MTDLDDIERAMSAFPDGALLLEEQKAAMDKLRHMFNLHKQLRDQVGNYLDTLDRLRVRVAALREECTALSDSKAAALREQSRLQVELADARSTLHRLNSECIAARGRLGSLTVRIKRAQQQLDHYEGAPDAS